jgi:RimJ/RimL family protein N-acetyltransferase
MTTADGDNSCKAFYLSEYSRNDIPQIVEALSNPLVAKGLRQIPVPYSASHALEWFDSVDEDNKHPETAPLRWAIREPTSDLLIGDLSLRHSCDGVFRFGYWLAPKHWGKGIMTSALAEVLDIMAKSDLRVLKFTAQVKEGNIGSRRVLEKNGFEMVGQHKDDARSCILWEFELSR